MLDLPRWSARPAYCPRWFPILGLGGLVLTAGLIAKAGTLKVAQEDGVMNLDEGRLGPRLFDRAHLDFELEALPDDPAPTSP